MTEESANGLEEQGVLSLDMEENCLAMKYYMYSGLITETVSTFTDESKAEEDEIPHAPTVDTTYRETIDTSEYESGSITSTTIGDSRSIQIDQSVFDTEEWQTFCDHTKREFIVLKQKAEICMMKSEDQLQDRVIPEYKHKYLAAIDDKSMDDLDKKLQEEVKKLQKTYRESNSASKKLKNLNTHKYDEGFGASLPDDPIFTEEYRHRYKEDAAVDANPLVTRYGICSDKFSHLRGAISLGMLHPVEFYVLSKAIEHLLEIPADTEGYKANVVLCDIFAREKDDDRVIKIDKKKDDRPEVHTVALWRSENDKVVLIDPNKEEFSQIIPRLDEDSEAKKEVSKKSTKTKDKFKDMKPTKPQFCTKLWPNIDIIAASSITPTYKQFYQTGDFDGSEGKNKTDLRDCIDVAVKIGFELNECQRENDIAIKEILGRIYEKMATQGDTYSKLKLLRDAHSSDANTRDDFYKNIYQHALKILTKKKK